MEEYSKELIMQVWRMGKIVENVDPRYRRKDFTGAWIKWDEFGSNSPMGWSIDHKYPKSLGGDDNILNLRPMQWENKLSKSTSYPTFVTVKSSEGLKNIDDERTWTEHHEVQKRLNDLYYIEKNVFARTLRNTFKFFSMRA